MAMAHSAIFRIGAVAAGDIAAAEQDFRGWDTAHYRGGRAAFGALIAAGASVAADTAPDVAAVNAFVTCDTGG